MSLVFDIFQGIGVAAAVGIRPFLPTVAVGALAAGDVEIHFDHTSYSYLQSVPFLLILFVAAIAVIAFERSTYAEYLRTGPTRHLIPILSLVIGALLFAGSLRRGGYLAWPGIIAGVLCAAVGVAASIPFLARLRKRLDAAAAEVGLPLIAEGSALVIAVLSVLVPPLGPIALLSLIWLILRGRRRGEQKYAGLRILR